MTLQSRACGVFGSRRQRLLAVNLMILAAGEAFSKAVTTAAFVHLARVFRPSTYGSVELVQAVMVFLTLAADEGLGTLGAREVARHLGDVATLVRRVVSMQTTMAVLIYGLLTLLVLSLGAGSVLTILVLGYGASLLVFPFILYWVFQGRDQMMWVALPQALRQTIFSVVVLLLVRGDRQLPLLPIGEFVSVAAAAAVSVFVLGRAGDQVILDVRGGWDRHLLAESLPIGGSQLIWALRMYLPTLLVGALAGQAAVAFFAVAHRIVMALQTMLEVYFRNLYPTMSQIACESTARLARLLRRSMWFLVVPSLVTALTIALAAPALITLVFGAQYSQRGSARVLAVLIWMIPVLAWRRHGRNALIAMGHQREEWMCALAGAGLLVLLVVPLAQTYGGLGAAWAMVVSEFTAALLGWWRVRHHIFEAESDVAPK